MITSLSSYDGRRPLSRWMRKLTGRVTCATSLSYASTFRASARTTYCTTTSWVGQAAHGHRQPGMGARKVGSFGRTGYRTASASAISKPFSNELVRRCG